MPNVSRRNYAAVTAVNGFLRRHTGVREACLPGALDARDAEDWVCRCLGDEALAEAPASASKKRAAVGVTR